MNILAFDTSFDACSAAVGLGLGTGHPRTTEISEPMQTGHAERLVPMLDEVLRTAGIGWDDLHRIGVTIGPGTFTGTRIAVSAARALALVRGLPVVALSSLEVMALSTAVDASALPPGATILVAVDARRDEVYAQHFGIRDGAAGPPLSEPAVLPVAHVARAGGSSQLAIVGSAAAKVATEARGLGRDVVAIFPAVLPSIGDALWRFAELAPLTRPPSPLYLRQPDAKPPQNNAVARAEPRRSR